MLASCIFALSAAWRWHDAWWWGGIHALFFPSIFLALQLNISPLWYLLAFTLSWVVFGRVAVNRAPIYLSNRQVLTALEARLPKNGHFLDIGAGTGTVLAWLVKRRPDLQLYGIEQAWLPWLLGRFRLPSKVKWLRGDYQKLDFANFDMAYAFLSPVPMEALWQKAQREMRPGTLFLSNTFIVPGVAPDEMIELGDWKGGRLLLWHM
ncbi:MAG: class I SAM-dependent methyltransferase [Formivibrio sp.]|nr:class I SAM-dependent methyltransferase [Formivibrio sp.]